MPHKLLFILKKREGNWGYGSKESGLSNSVRFVVDALNRFGIQAKSIEVDDNNCIDREVTAYRPTHVIIEAFWVVPEKFDVLKPLHPGVKWIVRNHSETPFLANEGIAFGWIIEYLKRGVEVMCNSPKALADVIFVAQDVNANPSLVTFGPNIYPLPKDPITLTYERHKPWVDIGCFGAIRPLKNHMIQALAAIAFADTKNLKLNFHINATRTEGKGEPILKNLRELFSRSRHDLIEHGWMTHSSFLSVLGTMDILSQVSYTETFNIVAADAMFKNIPIVTSAAIPWIGSYAHRDPNDIFDILKGFSEAWTEDHAAHRKRIFRQRQDMLLYVEKSLNVWLGRFRQF